MIRNSKRCIVFRELPFGARQQRKTAELAFEWLTEQFMNILSRCRRKSPDTVTGYPLTGVSIMSVFPLWEQIKSGTAK